MKVTGSGSDDIGVFTIDGTYSTETNRIDLIKTYQLGTGNSLENFGHQVTIQLTWDKTNYQFEGIWNIETDRYCDKGRFELKFNTELIQIQSDSDGTFNIDLSYPEQLNSYVTREEYYITRTIADTIDSKTTLVTEKLKATVKTFSDETFASPFTNPSEWTIQIDDFPMCTLSIKLLPPSQKDLVNTEATTNSFIL
ncbi:unnamed protein product [Adineta steineri]|uniref:Uncharacterized protein n=1 Tax=Adineta steineri TaxID=433720 RepID=A0A818ZA85_9BILA|nr:unnamed protein product [Adineta steineri]CAF3760961.1 unnamed protein product [Adineta steineri]